MLRTAIWRALRSGSGQVLHGCGQADPDRHPDHGTAHRTADCAAGFIQMVPRTIAQAGALTPRASGSTGSSPEITDQEIEERMSGRQVCSKCGASFHIHARPTKAEGVCDNCGGPVVQRDDDKPETVRHRLEVYHQQTEPLKGYYQAKGLLTLVENRPTIEATTQAIMEALQS
ncbi:MAG: adenylate kinase family protein [Flavonifractor plautii]